MVNIDTNQIIQIAIDSTQQKLTELSSKGLPLFAIFLVGSFVFGWVLAKFANLGILGYVVAVLAVAITSAYWIPYAIGFLS